MNCEIEFLPVGDGCKGGDAIVIRYGTPYAYQLMVLDGGNIESGKAVVEHIRAEFGADAVVSHLVVTHSDGDHASGAREVLNGLPVRKLWLHVPWTFASLSRPYFANENWTEGGLANALRTEFDIIAELVDTAQARGIPIEQPFAADWIGPFRVLSPSAEMYKLLLPQFDRTPEPDQVAIEASGWWIGKSPGAVAALVDKIVEKVQKWISENWDKERLQDHGVTSAINETSTVLYGAFEDGNVLLTGDAGIRGLTFAADYAQALNLPLRNFAFVQIPHHGSRRNVGPSILNRILGAIQPEYAPRPSWAFVSAPKDDTTHPRKMVLNAFMRRGFHWAATKGGKRVFTRTFPARLNYGLIQPGPFSQQVEDYD